MIYNADKTELTLNKNATSLSADDITSATKLIDASNISTGLSISAKVADSTIYGGKGADTITGGTGADYLDGGKGNDVLNGGAGNDTLTGGAGNDVFIYSGGKDVITDYGNGKNIISLSSDFSMPSDSSISGDGNDVILTFNSESTLTLTGAKDKVVSIQSANSTVVSAQIYDNNRIMNTKKTGVTLGAAYTDNSNSFDATSSMITIDGSAVTANTKLTGNGKANVISGGAGADTLAGGSGNDTLTGGAGSDTFVYSAGKDVITDFTPNEDTISISNVKDITNATFKDGKLILTINKQTLTLANSETPLTSDTAITINDEAYKFDKNQISASSGTTLYSAFKGTYTAADAIVSVDGSAANGAMNITGNNQNNVIEGGKKADTLSGGAGDDTLIGGAGNDSLYGGAGNDSLTGGAGKDIFVFGENEDNDTITDYTAGEDKIKLINNAEISNVSYNGENVIFEVGNGKITVENAKGSAITVIDSSGRTTTKVYTDEESVAARALDLIYDNNFMTDDAALDDITDAKYTVTDIDTDSKDEISKVQDLLTFSDKK